MSSSRPTPTSGTQSLERALRMLRELAARGEFGWRLSDLAAGCEIDKGTAHRVLACLVRERFVQQRGSDRRYYPGAMLYELGLSLPGYTRFQHAAQARLGQLAESTGTIAWLILRSGNEYVCAVRCGTLDLRGLMVQLGTRRPLFTSVGGAVILRTLPAPEMRYVLRQNRRQEVTRRGTARLDALRRLRLRTRQHGFGVNLGDVAQGVHAFAVPLRAGSARAVGAICLSCGADQFGAAHLGDVRALLEAAALDIEASLQEHLGGVLPDSPPA